MLSAAIATTFSKLQYEFEDYHDSDAFRGITFIQTTKTHFTKKKKI